MKLTMKTRWGIPAFALVFVMALTTGMVLAGCDLLDDTPPGGSGSTLSGTYFSNWDPYVSLTFSGNSATLMDTEPGYQFTATGTYTVSGNTVTITISLQQGYAQMVDLVIVSSTTLRDPDGNLWIKR